MFVQVASAQLLYPEVDSVFRNYHEKTILALPPSSPTSHKRNKAIIGMIAPDNPDSALQIASENHPCSELFAAVCPTADNSMPMFVYSSLARPDIVASIVTDKSIYRTYEQAARMMPASLLDHEMTAYVEGSSIFGVEASKGMRTSGMLLFSTTGRERSLIARFKGSLFKNKIAKAEIVVAGKSLRIDVMVWAWADEDETSLDVVKAVKVEHDKRGALWAQTRGTGGMSCAVM